MLVLPQALSLLPADADFVGSWKIVSRLGSSKSRGATNKAAKISQSGRVCPTIERRSITMELQARSIKLRSTPIRSLVCFPHHHSQSPFHSQLPFPQRNSATATMAPINPDLQIVQGAFFPFLFPVLIIVPKLTPPQRTSRT